MPTEPYTICGFITETEEYIPLETVNSWLAALGKAKVFESACESHMLDKDQGYIFDCIVIIDADNRVVWVPGE